MRKFDRRNGHEDSSEVVEIALDEIFISEKNIQRVMRDEKQIQEVRRDFERGRNMGRVVLRPRIAGGYDVRDGRHRVIAAKIAGIGYIDAIVID